MRETERMNICIQKEKREKEENGHRFSLYYSCNCMLEIFQNKTLEKSLTKTKSAKAFDFDNN
jgi:hypothetical protein